MKWKVNKKYIHNQIKIIFQTGDPFEPLAEKLSIFLEFFAEIFNFPYIFTCNHIGRAFIHSPSTRYVHITLKICKVVDKVISNVSAPVTKPGQMTACHTRVTDFLHTSSHKTIHI